MRSMANYLKPSDICAQLRMERQNHKGIFVLVEGSTDTKRFSKFYDLDSVSFINCYGKENLVGAIDIEQNSGREDCLGFADADFDRLTPPVANNDDIIISHSHDFDLDICSTGVVGRYMAEVADDAKMAAAGGCEACVLQLLNALRPLSALRYANVRHALGYKLDRVDLDIFFDGHQIDIQAMIDHVSQGRFSTMEHKQSLRDRVDQYQGAEIDIWQFTNGHDFIAALGLGLRDRFGSRIPPHTWRSEVERHLRLAFDVEDFRQTGHLARIRAWEGNRNVGAILKQHVN